MTEEDYYLDENIKSDTDKYQNYRFSIVLNGGTKERRKEVIKNFKRKIQESIPTQVGKVTITLVDFERIK